MNDPEGFLSRWARRKRAVAEAAPAPADAPNPARPREGGDPELDSRLRGNERNVDSELSQNDSLHGDEKAEKPEVEFDLSKLPSIESITAETDIRPFLARGVPSDLRQAALRRAWVADPHIRDFIGIAENQGDFTGAGEAMAGFDFSPPTGDIARLVAEIFGEKQPSESREQVQADVTAIDEEKNITAGDHLNVTPAVTSADAGNASPEPVADAQSVRLTVAQQIEGDVALQKDDAAREEKNLIGRRAHGGAMPK